MKLFHPNAHINVFVYSFRVISLWNRPPAASTLDPGLVMFKSSVKSVSLSYAMLGISACFVCLRMCLSASYLQVSAFVCHCICVGRVYATLSCVGRSINASVFFINTNVFFILFIHGSTKMLNK